VIVMKPPRRTALTLVLAVFVAEASAQQAAPPSAPPTFSSNLEMVVVDAVVIGKEGGPVAGLRREDFRITEDGVPQDVATFEAVDVAGTSAVADAPEAAAPAKVSMNTGLQAMNTRSFVLIFDQVHLSPLGAQKAKQAISQFLRFGPREGDTVMIVGTGGGSWWMTRTDEGKEQLQAVLKRLEGRYVANDTPDQITDYEAMRIWEFQDALALERVRRRLESYFTGRSRSAEGDPVRGTDTLTDADRSGKQFVSTDEVRNRAQDIYQHSVVRNRTTLSGLARVLDSLGGVRGRKTVVLLSEGFIQDRSLEEYNTVIRAAQRANTAIYFVDARGMDAMPQSASAQMGPLLPAADVATRQMEELASAEGADTIALNTGGFSIKNTNDLERGMRRIAQEARRYYLLGYSSTNGARDGKWRKIEVKVARPDVEVRARKGYYAPQAGRNVERAEGPWRPGLQQALDSPYEFGTIPLRMTHHVFDEAVPGKARTLVSAEIDLRSLALKEEGGRAVGTLEVLLVVTHRETGEFQRHDQKLELKLPSEARATLDRNGLPFSREFNLFPGGYQAKLVIRETGTGVLGSVTHEFEVPEPRGWRTSTPVLSDALEPRKEGSPVQLVIPARRVFGSGAPLYFQFEVYGSAADPASQLPRVSSGFTLRSADGTVVSHGDPAPIRPTAEGRLARIGRISLDKMPAGRYELVLEVKDEVAGKTLEVREPFTVQAVSGS
jgi:VWFA-related protein